jgi:hypothetical protein
VSDFTTPKVKPCGKCKATMRTPIILVVDDESALLQLMAKVLARQGVADLSSQGRRHRSGKGSYRAFKRPPGALPMHGLPFPGAFRAVLGILGACRWAVKSEREKTGPTSVGPSQVV